MIQSSKYAAIAAALLALGALSACGGGSGGGAAAPATANGEVALAAKTRALTVFDVTVTPYKASASDTQASRFEVKVSDAGAIATLSAAVGGAYDSASAATVTPSGTGAWNVTVPAGAAADASLLLSFNLGDGDVFETGRKDFPLK
jgi:hypothetical protein